MNVLALEVEALTGYIHKKGSGEIMMIRQLCAIPSLATGSFDEKGNDEVMMISCVQLPSLAAGSFHKKGKR